MKGGEVESTFKGTELIMLSFVQFNDEQVRVSFESTRLISFQVLRDAAASLLQHSPFDSPDRPSINAGLLSLGNGTAAAAAPGLGMGLLNKDKDSNQSFSKIDVLKEARLTIKVSCIAE